VTGALTLVATAALAAACGGSSSGGGTPTGGSSSSSGGGSAGGSVNQQAVAKLPAAIKSAGVVKVATDASYAPNEFFASNNKTIEGMDVDLGNAIGKELGLKFQFSNVSFDSIIPALGNRYDLGMSSFTDNKDREKVVDMVDYFSAGTSFMVKSSSTLNPTSVASLCGHTVAAEKGTVQLDAINAQAKKCKLNVLALPDQNQANLALQSGRADVVLADSPVNAYAAKQSNGAFKIVGKQYGTAPYGIAVPKSAKYKGLAQAIQIALKDLSAKGTYMQILKRWGIESGAIANFTIDGATS
jgi:polar amino acid transport system substrate-binding protein